MPDENSLMLLKAAIKEVLDPAIKELHTEIHEGKKLSENEINELKNKFDSVSKQVCTTGDCVTNLQSTFNEAVTNMLQEQKEIQETNERRMRQMMKRKEPEEEVTEEEVLGKYLNFCPHCVGGHKIGSTTMDAICVNCGSVVSSQWASCPNCGGNQAVPITNEEVKDVYKEYKEELKRIKQL